MRKIQILRIDPADRCLVIKPDDVLLLEEGEVKRPSTGELQEKGLEDALALSRALGPAKEQEDNQCTN